MSWLIQVFIENTRMSHFFLSLSVSLFVIARLVIYFFMSLPDLNGQSVSFPQPSTLSPVPLNIIVLPFSPLSLPSPLSVITRLDRVISLPLPPIFRMPRSSRSIHLLPTSSQQSCPGLTGASPGFFLVTYSLPHREQPDREIGIRSFRVNKLPREGVVIP